MRIDVEDLKIGEVYEVEINDCCVEGFFVSKLTNLNMSNMEYKFENGVSLSGHGFVFNRCNESGDA